MWGHGGFSGGAGWMGIGMVIFWLVPIALLLLVLSKGRKRRTPSNSMEPRADKSAMDILNERYARGEIDKIEYEQKKRDLQN